MRTLRFLFVGLLASGVMLWVACGDDSTNPDPTPAQPQLHEIRDVDYVHNTYFFFDHPEAFIGPVSTTVKVYRTVLPQDLVADPTIVHVTGWAVPDSLGCGEPLRGVVNQLNSSQVPTDGVEQEFALLQLGTDYAFVKDATNVVIGIELTEAIPDTEPRALAVSYQNVDGWLVGGTYQVMEVLPGTPGYPNHLLLEMLKAPDPDPQGAFASTWHLEMRNVYDLGFTNMDGSSLEIDIVDVFRLEDSTPEGSDVPYLQIFGLDQTDAAGTGDRDGLIDLAYVNLARGLLIVPSLQPFHPDPLLVDAWTGGQFAFTGLYAPQYDTALAIYNEKLTPTREGEVSQYIIRVLAKGAATR